MGEGAAAVGWWCERAAEGLAAAREDLRAVGAIEWAGAAGRGCDAAVGVLLAGVVRLDGLVDRAHDAARRVAVGSPGAW